MIAGAGFALMAWRLACSRVVHSGPYVRYYATRDDLTTCTDDCYPVHREYYRIIDKAALRFKNLCGDSGCFCARPRL